MLDSTDTGYLGLPFLIDIIMEKRSITNKCDNVKCAIKRELETINFENSVHNSKLIDSKSRQYYKKLFANEN